MPDQHEDVAALKARIAELERELADRTERAALAVAAAQERTYWLDRWHLDLNRVMENPLARRLDAAQRAARRVKRAAGSVRRRLAR